MTEMAVCEICGNKYVRREKRQRTCSNKCRFRLYYLEHKPAPKEPAPAASAQDICKTCIYSQNYSWDKGCGYILIMGEPRGCPPGEGCTRYKQGTGFKKLY